MIFMSIMMIMMMILAIMMARAISYRRMHFTAFLRLPLEGANKFAPKIVLALHWHCVVWGGFGAYNDLWASTKFAPKWHCVRFIG